MDSFVERYIATIERLESENAKLRERIHELEMEGSDHFYRTAYAEDANRTLEAENAELRELVRIAIEYCVNGYCAEEDECPLYESRHSCRLCVEARELGVEVE